MEKINNKTPKKPSTHKTIITQNKRYKTNTGHPLTIKEAKFIDEYIATGNARQSVLQAGYSTNAPGQYATSILNKTYIAEEIKFRLDELKSQKTADAVEIMEYLTGVMRGEIKDQFGLDAPLGERTKAAQELAKRIIDIPNKVDGKAAPEVKITLDWKRD